MGDISKLNVGGTLYDIKDAKARTDVSDLKEDIDYTGVLNQSIVTGGTSFDGGYIRNDGTIGGEPNNGGYIYNVLPNTMYVLNRNNAIGMIGFGYASTSSINFNSELDGFKYSSSDSELVLITNANAKKMFVYAPIAYKNTISLVQKTRAIDSLEESINDQVSQTRFESINISALSTIKGDMNIDVDGSLISQSNRILFYFRCEPNTYYKVKINSPDTDYLWRLGYTSQDASQIVVGAQLDSIVMGSEAEELKIFTPSNAKYVVFASRAANFYSNIVFYQEIKDATRKQFSVQMEHGNWNVSSGYENNPLKYIERIRSSFFIDVDDNCRYISFQNMTDFAHTWTIVYYYASDYSYLGYTESQNENPCFDIMENTRHIRIQIYTTDNVESVDVVFYGSADTPKALKNPNLSSQDPMKITFKISDTDFATSRLFLPPNYTVDGNAVPLILWLDGTGNFASWDGSMSAEKMEYLRYLRDEGFAVLSIFSMGYNYSVMYPSCGIDYPFPIPKNIEAITKGVEFMLDRFNIDANNIHLMSKSRGGQCCAYFASRPPFEIRSIGMFAPVIDALSMPGGASGYADVRKVISDELGFTGEHLAYYRSDNYETYTTDGRAFWNDNKEAACQLNPAWLNLTDGTLATHMAQSLDDGEAFWSDEYWEHTDRTDIYTHHDYHKVANIPVKVWGAPDDAATPYLAMTQFVSQLQNAGCEAVMRTFSVGTGGHSAADVDGNKLQSVTTALGIVYTNLPAGWKENVDWIRLHMWK